LFEVRQAILGHLQQGGDPSPFDRIQATRLAVRCIEFLIEHADRREPVGAFIGYRAGKFNSSARRYASLDGSRLCPTT
jgi:6-phosphofructokinase 1